MYEETEEQFLAWRDEVTRARLAGLRLVRQQAHNRLTDYQQWIEDLEDLIEDTRDLELNQRYQGFVVSAQRHWQLYPSTGKPPKPQRVSKRKKPHIAPA